ncbi:MAG: hypothetical protein ACTHNY_07760 [Solirubrobacterales bacterium]
MAGCGSDSSTNASATDEAAAPLTKAQFVKQAAEICQEGMKKKDEAVSAALQKLAEQAQGPPSGQETAELVEGSVLPSYRKTIDGMSQLGVPKGDEAAVEKMLGEFEAALETVEAEPAKATKSDPFKSPDEAAEAYGIENCRL